MNTLQLEYLLEVARAGSISQAASNLYMNQPNLSKSIKELEESLGIVIFHRTTRGVTVTQKGKEFLKQAQVIVDNVKNLKDFCKEDASNILSLAAPQASYISVGFYQAISRLSKENDAFVADYRELLPKQVLSAIAENTYNLGIMRNPAYNEDTLHAQLGQSSLEYQLLYEYTPVVTVSQASPLAHLSTISLSRLEQCTEITPHPAQAQDNAHAEDSKQHIQIIDRSMQYMLLQNMPDAYVLTSPMPSEILEQEGLIQVPISGKQPTQRDYLIFSKNYSFSYEDQVFLQEIGRVIEQLHN